MLNKQLNYFQFFIVVLCVSVLAGCGGRQQRSHYSSPAEVRPAKLITVERESSAGYLNFPAVIESSQLTVMSFEVGGVLNALTAVEGSRVKKGDVLAQLDQRDLQARLNSAKAKFKHAQTEYKRALRLIEADAISQSILEQREYQFNVSKSRLRTATKALQDSIMRAPFSGSIAKVSVEQREMIRAGEPAITILGKGKMEAKLNLPSRIMAKAGEGGKPRLEGYLVLDVAPQRHIPATFKSASLEADAASQTYEVSFTFSEPEGLMILPGMNGVVWLKAPQGIAKNSAAVSIPLTSIASDGDKQYVWVVDSHSMRLSRRDVVLEESVGASLKVIKGLKIKEVIVAAGISYLSEGMKIRPWSN